MMRNPHDLIKLAEERLEDIIIDEKLWTNNVKLEDVKHSSLLVYDEQFINHLILARPPFIKWLYAPWGYGKSVYSKLTYLYATAYGIPVILSRLSIITTKNVQPRSEIESELLTDEPEDLRQALLGYLKFGLIVDDRPNHEICIARSNIDVLALRKAQRARTLEELFRTLAGKRGELVLIYDEIDDPKLWGEKFWLELMRPALLGELAIKLRDLSEKHNIKVQIIFTTPYRDIVENYRAQLEELAEYRRVVHGFYIGPIINLPRFPVKYFVEKLYKLAEQALEYKPTLSINEICKLIRLDSLSRLVSEGKLPTRICVSYIKSALAQLLLSQWRQQIVNNLLEDLGKGRFDKIGGYIEDIFKNYIENNPDVARRELENIMREVLKSPGVEIEIILLSRRPGYYALEVMCREVGKGVVVWIRARQGKVKDWDSLLTQLGMKKLKLPLLLIKPTGLDFKYPLSKPPISFNVLQLSSYELLALIMTWCGRGFELTGVPLIDDCMHTELRRLYQEQVKPNLIDKLKSLLEGMHHGS